MNVQSKLTEKNCIAVVPIMPELKNKDDASCQLKTAWRVFINLERKLMFQLSTTVINIYCFVSTTF